MIGRTIGWVVGTIIGALIGRAIVRWSEQDPVGFMVWALTVAATQRKGDA